VIYEKLNVPNTSKKNLSFSNCGLLILILLPQIQQYVHELNSLESRRGRKPLDVNNVVYWFKNARAAQKRAEMRGSGTPGKYPVNASVALECFVFFLEKASTVLVCGLIIVRLAEQSSLFTNIYYIVSG